MYKHGFSLWKLNIEKFRVTKDYEDYLKRMRVLLLTKLMKRLSARNLNVAMEIWTQKTEETKKYSLNIRRMTRRRNRKTLTKVFEAWCIVHVEQVRVNVIVRRALAKMNNRIVASMFYSWNDSVQEQIRVRVMLRRFGKSCDNGRF